MSKTASFRARIFDDAAVTTFLVRALAAVACWRIYEFLVKGRRNWPLTEWLINYSGGFVRRGLPGTVIHYLSDLTAIPAHVIVTAGTTVIYALALAYFLVRARRAYPLAFILSPVLIGGPVFSVSLGRKDVLVVLILAACLELTANGRTGVRMVLVNVLAIVAILSHEAFAFFALPALFVVHSLDSYHRGKRGLVGVVGASAAGLLAPLCVFALTTYYRGNSEIALAVNASWQELWATLDPGGCCHDQPIGSIEGLQWTTSKALRMSASVLTEFSAGIYVPLAWLATLLACGYALINFLDGGDTAVSAQSAPPRRQLLLTIMVFQLCCVLPLFVLGWDFGRWIFLWTASSVLVFLAVLDSGWVVAFEKRLLPVPSVLLPERYRLRPWMLLFIGIPGCCWSLGKFITATPIGSVGSMLRHLVRDLIRAQFPGLL